MSNSTTFNNILHHITVDYDGIVLKSDDTLFPLEIGSDIKNFHPIFISALPLILSQKEKTLGFPGLSISKDNVEYFCDLTIKRELDFIAIVFFNFTDSYTAKKKITQEHNEQEIKRQTRENRINL